MEPAPKEPLFRHILSTRRLAVLACASVCAAGAWWVIGMRTESAGLALPFDLPDISQTVSSATYGAWPAMSDPDYFNTVRNQFIAEKASFLDVDLSAMRLRVYKEGEIALEVPIKTKGKEGSWWETPSGLYRVGYKNEKAFSSLGHVYMPWSMQFQGNFFIHGWPYYPDGTPVSSSYSGGCIRLADEDAQAVYELTDRDMSVLVFEKDFEPDTFTYSITAPELSATSYLAADLRNNFILLAGNERTKQQTYTLPKIMTALIASEWRSIEKEITVPETALLPTKTPRLSVGDSYRIYDLLWPLTLEDSAEAAQTLASDFGSGEFGTLVQRKLESFGAQQTTISTASGLGRPSYTSAEDLFKTAKYLLNNRPFLLSLTTGAQRFAYGEPAFDIPSVKNFANTKGFVGGLIAQAPPNDALSDAVNAQGAATILFASTTPSNADTHNRDGIAVFDVNFQGQSRPIVFIVLGSNDPVRDIEKMRAYVSERYR